VACKVIDNLLDYPAAQSKDYPAAQSKDYPAAQSKGML